MKFYYASNLIDMQGAYQIADPKNEFSDKLTQFYYENTFNPKAALYSFKMWLNFHICDPFEITCEGIPNPFKALEDDQQDDVVYVPSLNQTTLLMETNPDELDRFPTMEKVFIRLSLKDQPSEIMSILYPSRFIADCDYVFNTVRNNVPIVRTPIAVSMPTANDSNSFNVIHGSMKMQGYVFQEHSKKN